MTCSSQCSNTLKHSIAASSVLIGSQIWKSGLWPMGPDWSKQCDRVYLAEWERIISGADRVWRHLATALHLPPTAQQHSTAKAWTLVTVFDYFPINSPLPEVALLSPPPIQPSPLLSRPQGHVSLKQPKVKQRARTHSSSIQDAAISLFPPILIHKRTETWQWVKGKLPGVYADSLTPADTPAMTSGANTQN